jgi:hypothetical protein
MIVGGKISSTASLLMRQGGYTDTVTDARLEDGLDADGAKFFIEARRRRVSRGMLMIWSQCLLRVHAQILREYLAAYNNPYPLYTIPNVTYTPPSTKSSTIPPV